VSNGAVFCRLLMSSILCLPVAVEGLLKWRAYQILPSE